MKILNIKSKMIRSKICFYCLSVFFCNVFSCTSEKNNQKKEIYQELSSFIGTKIILQTNNLLPINFPDTLDSNYFVKSKYKIFHFIDNYGCSGCKIGKLSSWNDLYKRSDYNGIPIIIIIHTNVISELKSLMRRNGFTFAYFVDFKNSFFNTNLKLPQRELLRTFLTRNDTVILVGNPLKNQELDKMYRREIVKNF